MRAALQPAPHRLRPFQPQRSMEPFASTPTVRRPRRRLKEHMMAENGVSENNGINEYKYFVGGEWRSAENGKLFDVYQPYDRALYARAPACGRSEAKRAVDAAAQAFPAWAPTAPPHTPPGRSPPPGASPAPHARAPKDV